MLVTQSCPTLCSPVDYSPQAPLPMKFSRQEHWSGLPFSSPGDLSNPGVGPGSPLSQWGSPGDHGLGHQSRHGCALSTAAASDE